MIQRKKRKSGEKRPGRKKPVRARPSRFKNWSVQIGVAVLFLLILGTVTFVFFVPTQRIDESKLVDKRRIIFEEPNPPAQALSKQKSSIAEGRLPLVAIIIDDMGYHEEVGKDLIALPLQLTFSFLPYAPLTRQLEVTAFSSGHTVLLHLPMQPEGRQWSPGPGALYVGEEEGIQKRILDTDLSWVPHAVGVNNHMGSLYTQNDKSMRTLLSLLEKKGLFFIDSLTTPKSVAYHIAVEIGEKTARRQIFLDNIQSEEKILGQLEKLIGEAQRQGRAIGIGHPYPETLHTLKKSVALLNHKVRLVGVDKLVH